LHDAEVFLELGTRNGTTDQYYLGPLDVVGENGGVGGANGFGQEGEMVSYILEALAAAGSVVAGSELGVYLEMVVEDGLRQGVALVKQLIL
jgi:hypothetical protein